MSSYTGPSVETLINYCVDACYPFRNVPEGDDLYSEREQLSQKVIRDLCEEELKTLYKPMVKDAFKQYIEKEEYKQMPMSGMMKCLTEASARYYNKKVLMLFITINPSRPIDRLTMKVLFDDKLKPTKLMRENPWIVAWERGAEGGKEHFHLCIWTGNKRVEQVLRPVHSAYNGILTTWEKPTVPKKPEVDCQRLTNFVNIVNKISYCKKDKDYAISETRWPSAVQEALAEKEVLST